MLAVDLSFKWPEMTGELLAAHGVTHVIGYAGCANPKKNVSTTRFADWRAHGLAGALVVEDTERDDSGHYGAGQDRGRRILAAAALHGYDSAEYVLFVAVDRDVAGAADEADVADYLRGFQSVVPVPGCYGDYQTLAIAQRLGFAVLWQSDSRSYSQGRVYPGTHLLQIYDSPRVAGLPVDLDEIHNQPLRFMGDDMQLDQLGPIALGQIKALLAADTTAELAHIHADGAGTMTRIRDVLVPAVLQIVQLEQSNNVEAIAAAVAAQVGTGQEGITLPALAKAFADELERRIAAAASIAADAAATEPTP